MIFPLFPIHFAHTALSHSVGHGLTSLCQNHMGLLLIIYAEYSSHIAALNSCFGVQSFCNCLSFVYFCWNLDTSRRWKYSSSAIKFGGFTGNDTVMQASCLGSASSSRGFCCIARMGKSKWRQIGNVLFLLVHWRPHQIQHFSLIDLNRAKEHGSIPLIFNYRTYKFKMLK
jgi:hypothetical protein